MRLLKNTLIFGVTSLVLVACGGGGGSNSITAIDSSSVPVSQSQYDLQTKAARDQFEKRLSDALADAEAWLDNNRREAGVITTPSGLQYRIDKSSPNPNGKTYEGDQAVIVHYEGSLTDGTVFDSSFERGRPESLKPSELIEGWQEALTIMRPGDEWTLFIPPALGYGEIGRSGSIPPNAALIFKVELR